MTIDHLDFTPALSCAVPGCGLRTSGYSVARCVCGDGGVTPCCALCYLRVRSVVGALTRARGVGCRTCGRGLADTALTWEPAT
ncbi:hypothetical protein [Georgenia sp. MJ170]|uniref:hypothetical protein n=1 Tax=Georgenia sunbinii TaxID=3117728 RepID=UPI002F26747F